MRHSTHTFTERANYIHNFKYDYSLVEYENSQTKVIIICPDHGEFKQIPNAHIHNKSGCPKCSIEKNSKKIRYTTAVFIEKAKSKHGGKYDYSLVKYKNSKTLVTIICPIHGEFEQNPTSHLLGCGCSECSHELKNHLPLSHFINKSNKIHNFTYDYSLITNYKNSRRKVKIKCKKGHIFKQTMKDHTRGNGCPKCSKKCVDTESFIRLSNEVHGNKYDYSKSEYITQKTKTIIICPDHGEFSQKPSNHYHSGRGCPRCSESQGEREIRKWLNENQMEFKKEYTFDGCVDRNKLRFDFYIPHYNMCIEFDGAQHFKPIERFGGQEYFEDIKYKDNIKNEFCSENEIELIRISYKEINEISLILSEKFLSLRKQNH